MIEHSIYMMRKLTDVLIFVKNQFLPQPEGDTCNNFPASEKKIHLRTVKANSF